MNNQELRDCLSIEYLENPMLEMDGAAEPPARDGYPDQPADPFPAHSRELTSPWAREDLARQPDIPDRPKNTVKQDIMMQLGRKHYPKKQWALAEYLCDCLDDGGFFTMGIDEAARGFGCRPDAVAACLKDLKRLEPVGIFSKDLSECLERQLEDRGIDDPNLLAIVRNHLADVMDGRIGAVTRALRLSTVEVRKYMLQLGKLNPRPLMVAQEGKTQYIVPDLLLAFVDGDWVVTPNDRWVGDYRINDYYIHMMQGSSDPELTAYFREKLERARFYLNCVEMRRSTIAKTVRAIAEIQCDFFMNRGDQVPMSLQDVADRIQMHPSTVSRAIKGKYLQYLHGTVLLKDLFTATRLQETPKGRRQPRAALALGSGMDAGSLSMADPPLAFDGGTGKGISPSSAHHMILDVVKHEDPVNPLSDEAISHAMAQRGISISRRTVAKYRVQLGIMNSDQRKYLAPGPAPLRQTSAHTPKAHARSSAAPKAPIPPARKKPTPG
jgi:RNA polymerase sigma-54 factor